MSRSYKKVARSGDIKDSFYKRYSNKKIRRQKNKIFPRMLYKRNGEKYNICDYSTIYYSFEDYWKSEVERWRNYYYKYKDFPKKEEVYKEWYRYYKMK